jgi:hypothetical protein
MRRTGDLRLALALSALAVTSCTKPHAGGLPTASPSPSTATASPTPTATPDLRESLRGALRTYFDALYQAGLDPAHKTDALAALMTPTCPCRRTVDVLRDEARHGWHIDYRYTLKSVTVTEAGATGGDISYTVEQSAGAERDASGRVVQRFPADTQRFSAHFARTDDRWLLARLTEFQ